MLTIKTDLIDTSWLTYIIDQFKQINLADFDIEIISLEQKEKYKHILYYVKQPMKDEITLFNCDTIQPNGRLDYLDHQTYIIEKSDSKNFTLNVDIFWNAFVFLSRYEEYLYQKNNQNIHSYRFKHPREDKSTFNTPIVNILFNLLERFLIHHFKILNFQKKQEAIIDLSHDVDYIKKTLQLRIKQTVFNTFNTIKSITQPTQFLKQLKKTVLFAFSNPSYWCFDYWEKLEKSHNKRSTFYIYVKHGSKSLKSWLIDPSYDIKENKKLQNRLKDLHNNGFTIGLHGSFQSATDLKQLQKEKEILEESLGLKIEKTRQHWLNYCETSTPYFHDQLFKLDSTLGWNDAIGFRSGCASSYHPYDFKEKKAFKHKIIPQVIMDSNLYDYSNDKISINEVKSIIETSKKVSKTTHISISWHQRVNSDDYRWHTLYEDLLHVI